MLKKILSIGLSLVLVLVIVAAFCSCGNKPKVDVPKHDYDSNDLSSMLMFVSDFAKTNGDATKENATRVLTSLGASYNSYLNNKSEIESFLIACETSSDEIFEAYKAVCIDYSKWIAQQDFDYYDYDGALEQFYNAMDKGFEGFYDSVETSADNIMNKCEYLIGTAQNDYEFEVLWEEEDAISDLLYDGHRKIYNKVDDYYGHLYDLIEAIYDNFDDGNKDIDSIIATFESENPIENEPTTESTTEKVTTATTEQTTQTTTIATTEETTTTQSNLVDGMRPEFKQAMDSYETFMTDYVDFMNKFSEDSTDLSLLADYADYMSKYADFVEDFEKWDEEEMNDTELAYYIDVQARVSKKLLEIK